MATEISTSWSLRTVAKEGLAIYQVWPGKNRFYCRGKCISGPKRDMMHQLCPIICAVVVIAVYYGVFAVPLARKVTIWLPITFAVVALITVALYLATHFTDPGIIPRRDFFVADLVKRNQQEIAQFLHRKRLHNPQDDTAGNTPYYDQNAESLNEPGRTNR
jgi:hypothetical protein